MPALMKELSVIQRLGEAEYQKVSNCSRLPPLQILLTKWLHSEINI